MQNSKPNYIVAVVVALLVSVGVSFVFPAVQTALGAASGGAIHNVADFFINGVGIGNEIVISKTGTIGAGTNQGYWKNTTGKTVVVDKAEIRWATGIASSSLIFYVATSTGTSIASDFGRPTGNYLLIDGATFATSSNPLVAVATSTSNGLGAVQVPNGSYLNFQIQSKNGAPCNGAGCETATSTNRGITSFIWYLRGHYIP